MKMERVLFWTHLGCGLLVGVMILIMSVTAELNDPPSTRRTVELSAVDARLLRVVDAPVNAAPATPGQRARRRFRFVHTGQEYGINASS